MFDEVGNRVPADSSSGFGISSEQGTSGSFEQQIHPQNSSAKTVEIHFDPLVMHTISLLQYERKMKNYRVRLGPPPPVPAYTPVKSNLPDMQDMANEFSDKSIEFLLRKAVAVLAAHLGFFKMESSAVYLLSRIVAARLRRMCENLKLSHRRRVEGRETAFPSALMHALRLENIRNVTELQEFYRNRVVSYQNRMMLSCMRRYEKAVKKFAQCQTGRLSIAADEAMPKCGTDVVKP